MGVVNLGSIAAISIVNCRKTNHFHFDGHTQCFNIFKLKKKIIKLSINIFEVKFQIRLIIEMDLISLGNINC